LTIARSAVAAHDACGSDRVAIAFAAGRRTNCTSPILAGLCR
jgi:hypothetical protein